MAWDCSSLAVDQRRKRLALILPARLFGGIESNETTMTSVDRLGFQARLKTQDGMRGTRIFLPIPWQACPTGARTKRVWRILFESAVIREEPAGERGHHIYG